MRVFVASRGESYEGDSIIGIFTDETLAVKTVLREETHFEGGWIAHESIPNFWTNGCDYITISEWIVNTEVYSEFHNRIPGF